MNHKIFLTIALIALSLASFSQSKASIGFKTGYDHNYFIHDHLYGNNYSAIPDFNVGIDASLHLNDWFRVRTEVKYVNVSSSRYYDTPSNLPGNIKYSTLAINNINVNPYADFRLFSIKDKLELYYFFGMKVEFSVGDYQRSYTYAGETIKTSYINDKHKDVMIGSGTGFLLKYNINQNLGITLSPEGTIFYGEYYEKNKWHYVRSSVNLGVEWTF